MQKKYCIVPKKNNMFWELVRGMQLSREEKLLLKTCRIMHVEIEIIFDYFDLFRLV